MSASTTVESILAARPVNRVSRWAFSITTRVISATTVSAQVELSPPEWLVFVTSTTGRFWRPM